MSEEEKKEEKKKRDRYSIGQVSTSFAPVVMRDDEPLTLEQALVEILNKLEKIEKSL